jgi:hypothetical protein
MTDLLLKGRDMPRWLRLVSVYLVATAVALPSMTDVARAQQPDDAFLTLWGRTEVPVVEGHTARTWMWGPAITQQMQEQYAGGPDGQRAVRYFDKGRMEINTREGIEPSHDWYVTSGLLSTELVTGRMQVGHDEFESREPAQVNVAGDGNDPASPVYASFTALRDEQPAAAGSILVSRLSRDGTVTEDSSLQAYNVTAAHRVSVPNLDHQVASPFWAFMNSSGLVVEDGRYVEANLFSNPFFVTGYPITEAYWVRAFVAGTEMDVLVQVFERRVLTYTPSNPPGWQVEQANIGRHYYEWRYGAVPAPPPPVQDDIPPPVLVTGPDMGALDARLRPLVNSWPGQHAVTVTNLRTGESLSINGDRQHLAACTIKIYLMIAIAEDIAAGRYTHADIEHLILPAMGPSTTPEARELIRIIGNGDIGAGIHRMNEIIWRLGGTGSIITHPPAYPWEEYGYAASHGIAENLLTTNDLNRALGKIYRGEVLSPEMTEYVLWSLTLATEFLHGSFMGPVPDHVAVYHKIGVLYQPLNVWNDAGIFVFERDGQEHAYAISYLGTGENDYREAYWHGHELSRIVWEAFSTR